MELATLLLAVVACVVAGLAFLGTAALRHRAFGWEPRWRAQVAEMQGRRDDAKDLDTVAQHHFATADRWRRVAWLSGRPWSRPSGLPRV